MSLRSYLSVHLMTKKIWQTLRGFLCWHYVAKTFNRVSLKPVKKRSIERMWKETDKTAFQVRFGLIYMGRVGSFGSVLYVLVLTYIFTSHYLFIWLLHFTAIHTHFSPYATRYLSPPHCTFHFIDTCCFAITIFDSW